LNRKTQIILAVAASVSILAGAVWLAARGGSVPPATATSDGREVADMAGRTVRVPADPQRILSLCTSVNDTMVALDAAPRLAAVDEYGRVVPGIEQVPVIGKGSVISREQVQALRIDLAFVWWYQDDAVATLEGLGVPVVRIRTGRAAEVPAMIRLVGGCLNCEAKAEPLARHVEEFLAQCAARPVASRPRVYLELYGPYKTVGRDSYMTDLLELAGADNIAADTTGTVLLSSERLIQADPDAILFAEGFTRAETLAARPGMAGLRAVRDGRLMPIDRKWLTAGPRLPDAVDHIRGMLMAATQNERR
jgi:iron complex transport system substrate-binding protein